MPPPHSSVPLRSLWLVAGVAHAAGRGEEACRPGYYRSAPIVISCGGGSGLAHALLPPSTTTSVAEVDAGVRYFRLSSISESDVAAQLFDSRSGSYVADAQRGFANATSPLVTYDGVGVLFSEAQGKDNLYILGTLPMPLQLRYRNAEARWASLKFRYSYDGNERCPPTPVGCSLYNATEAQISVAAWAAWAQKFYGASAKAWEALGAPHLEANTRGGVRWYQWPAVFSQGDKISAPEVWQPAFHYLDADGDGEVSRSEFDAGFGLTASVTGLVMMVQLVGAVVLALLATLTLCMCKRARESGKARTMNSRSAEQGFLDSEVGSEADWKHQGDMPIGEASSAKSPRSPDRYDVFYSGDSGSGNQQHAWLKFFKKMPLLQLWGFGGEHSTPNSSFRYGPLPSSDDMAFPNEPMSHGNSPYPHRGSHGTFTPPYAISHSGSTSAAAHGMSFVPTAGSSASHVPSSGFCGSSVGVQPSSSATLRPRAGRAPVEVTVETSAPAAASAWPSAAPAEKATASQGGGPLTPKGPAQRAVSFNPTQPPSQSSSRATLPPATDGAAREPRGRSSSPSKNEIESVRGKLRSSGLAVFTPEEWAKTQRAIQQQRQLAESSA